MRTPGKVRLLISVLLLLASLMVIEDMRLAEPAIPVPPTESFTWASPIPPPWCAAEIAKIKAEGGKVVGGTCGR